MGKENIIKKIIKSGKGLENIKEIFLSKTTFNHLFYSGNTYDGKHFIGIATMNGIKRSFEDDYNKIIEETGNYFKENGIRIEININ